MTAPVSPLTATVEQAVGRRHWRVWGTSATLLVTRLSALDEATKILEEEIAATDAACNRFSPASELSRLNRSAGSPVVVGPVLLDDVMTALQAAALTDGAADPTIGGALVALGYDRDFDEIRAAEPTAAPVRTGPAPGWRSVRVDPAASTVELGVGVVLDLGSSAKARCADRAAERIEAETGSGTLVDLGGDLRAVGAPPPGGWQVGLIEDARGDIGRSDCVISLFTGALASSSTTVRTWQRGTKCLHHVIDPASGWPAEPVWRLVTVAGGTCSLANAVSTASVVWGEEALFRVPQLGLAGRFVGRDGRVIEVGDWPRPERGDRRATELGSDRR